MYKILIILTLIVCIISSKLGPIIIIPGLGGSALEARL